MVQGKRSESFLQHSPKGASGHPHGSNRPALPTLIVTAAAWLIFVFLLVAAPFIPVCNPVQVQPLQPHRTSAFTLTCKLCKLDTDMLLLISLYMKPVKEY